MRFSRNRRYHLILISIILVQFLSILYWGNTKEGYHIDEIYSYGLANSYYAPFIDSNGDYWNRWHDADYLNQYVSVPKEHIFSYDSVYDNQTKDVHPFMYYGLLHTICSLFPDTFSKWYAISINCLFSALTIVILYLMAEILFRGNKAEALLLCGVYAISAGALSNAVYLRMYVMLTFFSLLYTYLHVLMYKKWNPIVLCFVAGTVIFGGLTHYYFYVFAFFVSAFYVVFWASKREYANALKYCGLMATALAVNMIIYPSTMEHILYGYRGNEAIENLSSSNMIEKIRDFFPFVNLELYGGKFRYVFALCILAILIICIKKYVRIQKLKGKRCINLHLERTFYLTWREYVLLSFLGIIVGYYVIVSKITTIVANRYIFPIYPLILLITFWIFHFICTEIGVKEKGYLLISFCVWGTITLSEYRNNYVDYLYSGYQQIQDIVSEYSDRDTLYIADYTFPVYRDMMFLEKAGRFIPIHYTNLSETLKETDINRENGILVYVYKEHDGQIVFDELYEQFDLKNYDLIAETYQSKVYLCY